MQKIFLLFISLSLSLFLYSNKLNLISNKNFIFQNYNYKQTKKFFRSFQNNKFTNEDILYIFNVSKEFKISVIVIAAKLEQENCLVSNSFKMKMGYKKRYFRAMAYGLKHKKIINGKKIYKHGGFKKQIYRGTKLLRSIYDKWKKGRRCKINFGRVKITPINAATYSLYIYCPFYGNYYNYRDPCIGNLLFEKIFKIFIIKWKKLNK